MSYRALSCCGNCKPMGQADGQPAPQPLVIVLALLAIVAGGVWIWGRA